MFNLIKLVLIISNPSGGNSSSTQEVTYTQPSPTFGGHRNSMPSPIQPSFHLASPPQAPAGFFSPSPIPPAEPQHYPLPQPTMWQPSYVPPSEVTVTPSFIQRSPPPSRSASAMAAAARRSPLDLNAMENYNRAARGWGQSKDFYRPITFNKPKVVLGYTDFWKFSNDYLTYFINLNIYKLGILMWKCTKDLSPNTYILYK